MLTIAVTANLEIDHLTTNCCYYWVLIVRLISEMGPKTRQTCSTRMSDYLGPSKDLLLSELPTLRNVLCLGQLIMEENNKSKHSSDMSVWEMGTEVYWRVLFQHMKANVQFKPPVIMDVLCGTKKVVTAWNDVNDIVRKQKGASKLEKKIQPQLDRLFDIISCHCHINCVDEEENIVECDDENCGRNKNHQQQISCSCVRELKIPALEISFVRAQRLKVGDKSSYQMGGNDQPESRRQQATLDRQALEQTRDDVRAEKSKADEERNLQDRQRVDEFLNEVPDEAETEEDEEDLDYYCERVDKLLESSEQNRIKFPTVAAVSMRYGASNRETAAIATATMIDLGVVTAEDKTKVLDHNKVAREKKQLMAELRKKADIRIREGEDIICTMFDGRKNNTRVMYECTETGKKYPATEKMEHISVSSEPGGEYLYHFTPDPATKNTKHAEQVANKLVKWYIDHGVDQTLLALGGDSTNVNTGWEGGTFHFVEEKLGKKLAWLVCFLHTNELPLRHLVEQTDGPTTSDHTFSGPLGKSLGTVTELEHNPRFAKINIGPALIKLDQEVIEDLSSDQNYGYRMVNAIKLGKVPLDLQNMDIGPVYHARWLTTANRFLKLWVSKHGFKGKDLTNLKMIVEFIIGVYYPMWFEAKVKNNFIEGPRHILKQLELVRLQRKSIQDIVMPYVISSAWYSHSEAVLLTLLCSNDEEERRFGVKKLLKLRGDKEMGDTRVRPRIHAPYFNKNATKLTDLISWDENVYEPIFTCSLTPDNIREILDRPLVVPYLPVHGQSMERLVKQVTVACESVFGFEARDGFLRAREANRIMMPKNNTKDNLTRMFGN